MRELKFRAWDASTPTMIYFSHDDISAYILDNDCKCAFSLRELVFRNKAKIMQFTGLQDKNGKPIYEGDILCIEDENTDPLDLANGNHIAEVIFKNGTFGVQILEESRYLTTDFHTIIDLIYEINLESIEIIGNIFENPELLNGENNE